MAPGTGIILLYFSLFSVVFPCNTWMSGIGTVTPNGDIKEPEGYTLKIDCTLNSTIAQANSSKLLWKVNGTYISPEFIQIVDQYTAQLTITNVTAAHSGHYFCLYNNTTPKKLVCNNYVYIGFKPAQIENFTCTAYNWNYLTCTFNEVFNPIKVTYSMKIKTRNLIPAYECKLEKKGNLRICNYTKDIEEKKDHKNLKLPNSTKDLEASNSTKQAKPYAETDQIFYITINSTNELGLTLFRTEVNHYSRVLPEPLHNITIESLSERSITVRGYSEGKWKNFPPGLVYRLFYRSQWDPVDIFYQENLGIQNFSTLENLQPYTEYSLKIQYRSRTATDEQLWSPNRSISFQTLSDIPDRPPSIISGSFQERASLKNRNITLFWKAIPVYQRNGPGFKYCVEYGSLDDETLVGHKCSEDNNVIFNGLELEHVYEFRIYSENEKGRSSGESILKIDKRSRFPCQAQAFTVIYFDHGIYEVSWKLPSHSEDIVSFTLFWCQSIKPHPFMCKGNLTWIQVNRTVTAYNFTMANYELVNYQFGISSKTPETSSGMVWATCVVPYNGTLNKMKQVTLTSIAKDHMKVTWKLDCSERIGIIAGFNIYYCEIDSNSTSARCRNNSIEKIFVNEPRAEKHILENLKPFTFYKVTVSAMTRAGEGEISDPFIDRTHEAPPPMPVQNVKLSQGENKTIVVRWNVPTPSTGRIVKYIIYMNGSPLEINVNKTETRFITHIPYEYGDTNYSIQFSACLRNDGCSPKSNKMTFLTEIETPGRMSKPQLTLKNVTHILITFEDPAVPNGPIDFYNLKIVRQMTNNMTQEDLLQNLTSNDPVTFETHCHDSEMENSNISFSVQAVNVLNGTFLKGPFSEPMIYTCRIEPVFQIIVIAICTTVGIIVLILLLLYGYRRFRKKCWEIKNIKIHLPKGLEPESLKSPDFGSIQPQNKRTKAKIDARELLNQLNSKSQGSPRSRNTSGETRISSSSMDELIQNNGDVRTEIDNNSALGSVSSTQTTRSNLSTESGNDLESLPPTTPDTVFAENPILKRQSLPEPDLNKMQPMQLEKSVLPNEIPNSYSKFACYFNDENPSPNSGYLPTNASAPKGDNSAYVLPSSPDNSVTPALPYSQIGMAEGTNYMNYPCTNLPTIASPGFTNSLPSYSVVAVADNPNVQMRQPVNMAPIESLQTNVNMEPNENPGLGYCSIGLAASSIPKNPIHPGYVAASIAESPADCVPIQNGIEQQPLLEPDSLEEDKLKVSPSAKPYVPVASNIPGSMYSRVSLQQPAMSNGYVPQSKMETNSIQIGQHPSGAKEKAEGNIKDETSFIQPNSLETPSISTGGSTNSKPSTPKKNGYVSLSMMDDPSQPDLHCSNTPEIMKTSQMSDEYDSPGPYSRVVSMNYDEASINNVTDGKS